MGTYSIKELEVLTGIKAHTIRIWEQRYNILSPVRTETNIRTYTEEDLKHLLNVSLLNKSGLKISRIAHMNEKQVKEKVMNLSQTNFEFNTQVDALTVAMIEFDEESFDKLLATNILRIGFEETFLHIIFPFLHKVGLLWQTAVIRPAQEHFISNLIRQKIIVAIDGQMPVRADNPKKYLLFLPERELHEHSLLFTNYVVRSRGNHSLYLGASVPMEDLVATVADYKPDFMMTLCLAHPGETNMQQFINDMHVRFPHTHIFISGRQALMGGLVYPDNFTLVHTIQESIELIEKNSPYMRMARREADSQIFAPLLERSAALQG